MREDLWCVERKNLVTGEWVPVSGKLGIAEALRRLRELRAATAPEDVALGAVPRAES